jgi:H(+)-transporting ATP synthase subunit D
MSGGRVSPTRQSLLQTERALVRLDRGIALLRKKREALVTSLFRLVAPAMDAQARIADRAAQAHGLLAESLGDEGYAELAALAWPSRPIQVDLTAEVVWGLPTARLEQKPTVERSVAARGWSPSAAAGASGTAEAWEELLGLLIESAPRELLLRRLADAVARTGRQLNALERRVAPDLRTRSVQVRRLLEEREREDLVRLATMRALR